jgi:MinD superfamily P-loop ATPase
MVFDELCHSCGACTRICPHGAIIESPVKIGEVTQALCKNGSELATGTLVIGHSSAPAVINAVKRSPSIHETEYTIIDSPPGTACTFVAAVDGSDFVLLVTEATPFGLNDLKLAIEALQNMKLPFAIIINRSQTESNLVTDYCREKGFPILLQIPESRHVAETYARGGTLLDAMPELNQPLRHLLERCSL